MTKKAPLFTADMAAAPRRRKAVAPQRGQEADTARRVTVTLAADDLKRLKLLAIESGESQQTLVERAILDLLKKSGA
jgi:predicted DNA binding CopG/RHH family protein